jgi:hypothetical protein
MTEGNALAEEEGVLPDGEGCAGSEADVHQIRRGETIVGGAKFQAEFAVCPIT